MGYSKNGGILGMVWMWGGMDVWTIFFFFAHTSTRPYIHTSLAAGHPE